MTSCVLFPGVFDLFHVGHLRVLRRAAARGDRLVVAVASDEFCRRTKREPVIPEDERLEIIRSINVVQDAFIYDGYDFLDDLHVDLICHGPDLSDATRTYLETAGVPLICLPRTEGVSTSGLIRDIRGVRHPVVGVDFHDCVTYDPDFFRAIFRSFRNVYVVTGTPESKKDEVVDKLRAMGIEPGDYKDVLCGFEYSIDAMDDCHFERMALRKLELLQSYDVKVMFEDNPFYCDVFRNAGITTFQTLMSDEYMATFRGAHPFYTCHLQKGQFDFIHRRLTPR